MASSAVAPSSASTEGYVTGLTPEQLKFWDENGYLIVPDALSPSEVQECLSETHNLLSSFSLEDHPMTRFSTGEKHVGDDYFLTSGDKVRFFFEEDAFDDSGKLAKPKEKAINKIGHYLHALSPPFSSISLNERNRNIVRQLGFRDPRCLQSMVICKQPEIGARVGPHQDSVFLYTDPPSAVGFWYALEDATASNGCLSFAKGSHKRTPIRQRFVRMGEGEGTGFAPNTGAKFPSTLEVTGEQGEEEDDKEDYTMGEVKAGTLVLIHGNILHKSERNTSPKSRFIYTFHVIEGDEKYDERNWLQPPANGFSKLS